MKISTISPEKQEIEPPIYFLPVVHVCVIFIDENSIHYEMCDDLK